MDKNEIFPQIKKGIEDFMNEEEEGVKILVSMESKSF
jgi:hypothetical protein